MHKRETVFASLEKFQKGGVQPINDDPRNYAFSNIFEVASRAEPYEKIAVGKNLKYVLEAIRAEGTSPWFTASHDEAALVMDGEVEIRLVKLREKIVADDHEGTTMLEGKPDGRRMGEIVASRGHMALLPKGAAYQFHASQPAVILLQTIKGDLTVERWNDICQK
jgi:quercetin dioxygenase-like cupin family protein